MPRTYRKFKRRSSRRFSGRIRKRPIRRTTFRRRRSGPRRIRALWPNTKLYKLTYADIDTPNLVFDGSSIIQPSNVYKLNSAYDVNNAVLTSTMPGFLELGNMWTKYRVLAASITAKFWIPASYSAPLNVGIYFTPDTLGSFTAKSFQSLIRCNPQRSVCKELIPGYRFTTCRKYMSMASLYGDRKAYEADLAFTSGVGTNPTNIMYGYVYASGVNVYTGGPYPPAGTVICKVEVTQYIKFFDRDNEIS